jgi:meso-butanediol dehydrogenase/(S,S)-butanediol dehydrogenase/diacetyl reductase
VTARLEGKVAVITGAASGIGAATARRFLREGAHLMLADVNDELLGEIARELDAEGGVVAFQKTDVSDGGEVERLMQSAADRFGKIDVVFNNAGIGAYGKTPDLDLETWHRVIDVDLHSVFYGCRAAIPHLRRNGGGAIVNTASISGLFADYGLAAYNAAKGAVVNYTRTVAIDHARENIRANSVCPGAVETALTAAMLTLPNVVEEYARLIPMGRVGRAEEIAAAVAFLASDDASYITGAAIVIDGGLTAATGQVNFSRMIGES